MLAWMTLLGMALTVHGAWNEETSSEVLVSAGSAAVLPCFTSTFTQTPLTVQWEKCSSICTKQAVSTVWRMDVSGMEFRGMGVGQRSRCSHNNFGKGNFNLRIEDIQNEDGGNYICTVIGSNMKIQRQVTLRVIQVSASPQEPVEGSTVKMTCNMNPSPPALAVSWTLNGSPYQPKQRNQLQQDSASGWKEPNIIGVSTRHVGNWTCSVQHKGHKGNATLLLTIKGITNPAGDDSCLYVEVGSRAQLPCVFNAGLIPKNQVWSREKDRPAPRLVLSSPHSSGTPWDVSARIERVEVEDGGPYVCQGSVENRVVKRQLQLVTAQILQRSGSGKAPAMLTCHLSNTTGVTRYEWVLVTQNTSGIQAVTPFHWEKTLNTEKIKEKGPGKCVCRYYGKHGLLGNVTYNSHFTSAQRGEQKAGTPSAGMIFGLSVLFLVLLLIVLQLYRNYRRRKMILQYPALETIVHASVNAQEFRERNRANAKVQEQSLGS